tara:strand:+ start:36073 stop:36600 length:528 start_codon:yes stop_codon:yes gene_type:complete
MLHPASIDIVTDTVRHCMTVTEVEDGGFFAGRLFHTKYGHPVPDFGRHVVVFYRDERAALHVLSYLHFWRQDRLGLIGGACTDGNVMRAMPDEHARAINSSGGALHHTLLYAFSRFSAGIDAFFGHAGDARAREVDLASGFQETSDEYLLIKPVRPLAAQEQTSLITQALALGSF